jgi:hypothetical protein
VSLLLDFKFMIVFKKNTADANIRNVSFRVLHSTYSNFIRTLTTGLKSIIVDTL